MAEWIYFLHSPRDEFAATMTEEEQAAFAAHSRWLGGLLADGVLIVAGPTLGPVNTGIAIFEAPDEETARELIAQDPVNQGGFARAELRPYRVGFLRGATEGEEGAAMAVQLNHTIVRVRDKQESATFLAELLGVGPPVAFGPFLVVEVDNDVSLDFADDHGPVHPQHYAFLVAEDEFDQIFGRIRERGLPYWADPGRRRPGQINTNDGGRGVYWEDPSGHFLEIITRPYGSGPD